MTRAFKRFIDAVLPTSCIGCSALGSHICSECAPDFVFAGHALCRLDFHGCSATILDGPAHLLISAVKDEARSGLLPEISLAVVSALTDGSLTRHSPSAEFSATVRDRNYCIVPIPSSRSSFAKRGFDPVASLARLVARDLGVEVNRGLSLVRQTRDQRSLTVEQRQQNLTGAMKFQLSSKLPDRVLLLDDVVTTGATLLEGKRAIEAEGIPVFGFATFAETRSNRDA